MIVFWQTLSKEFDFSDKTLYFPCDWSLESKPRLFIKVELQYTRNVGFIALDTQNPHMTSLSIG